MPPRNWSAHNAKTLGELSAQVNFLVDGQVKLGEAIYGNGDPTKGMSSRMERIEASLVNASSLCEANSSSLATLTADVRALTAAVDAHQKSVHLATLLRSFKFWGLFIAGMAVLVIVVHDVFATGTGSASQAIWEFLKGLFL